MGDIVKYPSYMITNIVSSYTGNHQIFYETFYHKMSNPVLLAAEFYHSSQKFADKNALFVYLSFKDVNLFMTGPTLSVQVAKEH